MLMVGLIPNERNDDEGFEKERFALLER